MLKCRLRADTERLAAELQARNAELAVRVLFYCSRSNSAELPAGADRQPAAGGRVADSGHPADCRGRGQQARRRIQGPSKSISSGYSPFPSCIQEQSLSELREELLSATGRLEERQGLVQQYDLKLAQITKSQEERVSALT